MRCHFDEDCRQVSTEGGGYRGDRKARVGLEGVRGG